MRDTRIFSNLEQAKFGLLRSPCLNLCICFLSELEQSPEWSGKAIAERESKHHDLRLSDNDDEDKYDDDKGHKRLSREKVQVLETVIFNIADHEQ